jgi:hypothetical protein
MKHLQKMGGVAALLHSAAYVVGIGLYFSILSPILDSEPAQYVAQLADYKSLMYVWILICYLLAGFCLVVVSLALYERLKNGAPAMILTSSVLGCIWAALIIGSGNLMLHGFSEVARLYEQNPAQAETVWVTLKIVEHGIVSGNELTGGVWVLLLSWAALRTGKLNKALNLLGTAIGAAGILTLIPPLTEAAGIFFGLGMIIWFAWLGGVFLRKNSEKILLPRT